MIGWPTKYSWPLTTLIYMKVNPDLIIWISDTMSKRKMALKSIYALGFRISKRSPKVYHNAQCSALSPVLFNVYTVGIASNQLQGPGRQLSFADDVLAYRQGKSKQDIASGLQDELDRMYHWSEEYNGKLNPDKACVLWCTHNNREVKDWMPEKGKQHGITQRSALVGMEDCVLESP